jgi:ABC-type phosphate transport system substrate-binding protein
MKGLMKYLMMLIALGGPVSANAEDFILVVNAENPVTRLTANELASIYLKKRRDWPDGTSVRFIDRREGTGLRASFLSFIGKSGRDVELYWIGEKLYSGNAAPLQVDSDASVVSLISSLKGGIGYISSGFQVGNGVKKIEVIEGKGSRGGKPD